MADESESEQRDSHSELEEQKEVGAQDAKEDQDAPIPSTELAVTADTKAKWSVTVISACRPILRRLNCFVFR